MGVPKVNYFSRPYFAEPASRCDWFKDEFLPYHGGGLVLYQSANSNGINGLVHTFPRWVCVRGQLKSAARKVLTHKLNDESHIIILTDHFTKPISVKGTKMYLSHIRHSYCTSIVFIKPTQYPVYVCCGCSCKE